MKTKIMSKIQFDVIMTSLPIEVLLYIESSPMQRIIILLRPYKILERFLEKRRNYASLTKGPRFFRHPVCIYDKVY